MDGPIHIYQVMKTIAVRDGVYGILSSMKRKDGSFSDVILRLVEGRKGIHGGT